MLKSFLNRFVNKPTVDTPQKLLEDMFAIASSVDSKHYIKHVHSKGTIEVCHPNIDNIENNISKYDDIFPVHDVIRTDDTIQIIFRTSPEFGTVIEVTQLTLNLLKSLIMLIVYNQDTDNPTTLSITVEDAVVTIGGDKKAIDKLALKSADFGDIEIVVNVYRTDTVIQITYMYPLTTAQAETLFVQLEDML